LRRDYLSRPHQSSPGPSAQHRRDGRQHSSAAIFYLNGRLYEIEAKVLPPESNALAIRFQQAPDYRAGIGWRNNPRCRNQPGGESEYLKVLQVAANAMGVPLI
jgi:hypothetical protein